MKNVSSYSAWLLRLAQRLGLRPNIEEEQPQRKTPSISIGAYSKIPSGFSKISDNVYVNRNGDVWMDTAGHLRTKEGQAQLKSVERLRKLLEER